MFWLPKNHVLSDGRLFALIAWTILCAYMLVQVVVFMGSPVGQYDDAIPLVSSLLVQLGRTPAVDFKSFYPPLNYYLLAGGFDFFGRTVFVARFYAATLYVLLVAAIAFFFRTEFPCSRPLIPLMILVTTVVASVALNHPPWPGYSTAFLSLLVYLTSRSRTRDWRLTAFAGLLAGISTLIRFNFGFYVGVVIGADILLTEVLTSRSPSKFRLSSALIQAAAFGAPLGLANLIFYFGIYRWHLMPALLDMVNFSRQTMSRAFLPVRPAPLTLLCLVFPFAWVVARMLIDANRIPGMVWAPAAFAAILTGFSFFTAAKPSISLWFPMLSFFSIIVLHLFVYRLSRAMLCILLFHVCLQHYFLSRADYPHVLFLLPTQALSLPFLFAAPAALKNDLWKSPIIRRAEVLVPLVMIAGILSANWEFRPHVASFFRVIENGGLDPHRPDRERLVATDSSAADEVRAADYVRERTSPSTPIFVGAKNHAKSFMSDVRAYWLAERLPGVTYIHLDSAVAGAEAVQSEIISELQHNRVNYAILYDSSGTVADGAFWELLASSSVLDKFLALHFEEEVRFGRYSVVRRKY